MPLPHAASKTSFDPLVDVSHLCTADRYLDKTARVREMSYNKIDYMCRFDQKYSELNGSYDRFDGNPFT